MQKPTLLNEEYTFKQGLTISSTDLKGIITYVNRKFCEIAGYSRDELVGKNHNIIRHPDMPKTAFKGLWDSLLKGEEWSGSVKNLRKDGKYYWVHTHIATVTADNKIIGYTEARRLASKTEVEETIPVYEKLKQKESN